MKLASFEVDNRLAWGVVLTNPRDGKEWIYEPAKVTKELSRSATFSNGFVVSIGCFVPDIEWPDTMTGFLELEEKGMDALQKLTNFLESFLKQSDAVRMSHTGYPLETVHLRAPIPCPRLFWGLVANSTTFSRNSNNPATNFYPMAHQRPAGAVIGHGEIFFQAKDIFGLGGNVELGVIIGKKGRNIPITKAMDYVAGYTVVTDSQLNGLYPQVCDGTITHDNVAARTDWYVDATCSWGGKMADAHCGFGPYLTTKDEVGNLYDLEAYTLNGGMARERTHTAGYVLGVERTIAWYSTFATLYPGDVIHMGTMGTDGFSIPPEWRYSGPDCSMDSEIEKIGYLSNPIVDFNFLDWREKDDITNTIHMSPAVRDLIRAGKTTVTMDQWNVGKVQNFFTLFKNYRDAMDKEGYVPSKAPRYLATPNSALSESGSVVEVPARAHDLDICIELGLAVNQLTKEAALENAEQFVLGYMPIISITDSSFGDGLAEPTTDQQRCLPLVYGRWADGFNAVGKLVKTDWASLEGRKMTVEVEGIGKAEGNVSEYYSNTGDTLKFISSYVSMFPGDTVTFGHIAERVRIPRDQVRDGMVIRGSIEGLGTVEITLKKA